MELATLREELARCKADKEFVWSLWKQLQKESPDLTQAISSAVTREKLKHELVQEKLAKSLRERDTEIETLKQELDCREKTASKLVDIKDRNEVELNQLRAKHFVDNQKMLGQLNKATDEVNQLRVLMIQKNNEIDQHLKTIDVLMKRAGESEKQLKLSKTEMMRVCTVNTNLQETVRELQNRNQFMSTKRDMLEKDQLQAEIDRVNQALKEQQSEYHILIKHTRNNMKPGSLLSEDEQLMNGAQVGKGYIDDKIQPVSQSVRDLQLKIDQLQSENDALCNRNNELNEIIDEKERIITEDKRLMKLIEASFRRHEESSGRMGVATHNSNDLKESLLKTEHELFEAHQQLKAKEQELICIKEKHDKRLERMRNLKESHDLLMEQIKTYDQRGPSLSPRRSGGSHDYDDRLWSELSKYKTLYQETLQDKTSLEEELNCVQVDLASCHTVIAELKARLKLESKAMEAMRHDQEDCLYRTEKHHEELIEGLESKANDLAKDNSRLSKNNRLLNNECSKLKKEVNGLRKSVKMLRHNIESERNFVTTSTMTDLVPTADSTTQVEIASSEDRVIPTFSSVTSLLSSDATRLTDTARIRRYSDTHLSFESNRRCDDGYSRKRGLSSPANVPYATCTSTTDEPTMCMINESLRRPTVRKQRSRSAQPQCKLEDSIERKAVIKKKRPKTMPRACSAIPSLLLQRKKVTATVVEANNMKRLCSEEEQNLRWKLKKYQQKLANLIQQMAVLTQAKDTLTKTVEEEQNEKQKQNEQIKTLLERNTALKMTVQGLRNDLKNLETTCSKLKGKCEGLESMGSKALGDKFTRGLHLQEENKKIREEKKLLSERVSVLSSDLKSVQAELKQRQSLSDELQQRVTSMERDLRQKRILITDHKKKLSTLEDQRFNDREKISSLLSQVETLQTSLDHFKQRVYSLKSQSEQFMKEKKLIKSEFLKCQKQLDETNEELHLTQCDCKKKCEQLMAMSQQVSTIETKHRLRNESSQKQYQLTIMELEKDAEMAQLMVNEYRNLIMELAKVITLMEQQKSHEKRSCLKTSSTQQSSIDVKSRARSIAQSMFELSDIEVEEFMSGNGDSGLSSSLDIDQTGLSLAGKVGVLLNENEYTKLPNKQLIAAFSSSIQSCIS